MKFLQMGLIAILMAKSVNALALPPSLQTFTENGPFPPEADNPANWAHVPGGVSVHPSCHHNIPAGSSVDGNGNVRDASGGLIGILPTCKYNLAWTNIDGTMPAPGVGATANVVTPGTDVGWVEDIWAAALQFGGFQGFNLVTGTLTVPPAPAIYESQVIFIFNSLSSFNRSTGEIFQPVLQYGNNCTSNCNIFNQGTGGMYWQVSNWAVGQLFGSIQDTPQRVSAGDTLQLTVQGATHTTYFSSWSDSTKSISNSLAISLTGNWQNVQFNTAQPAVLEAYNISQCGDYPAYGSHQIVQFRNAWIEQANWNWTAFEVINPPWLGQVRASSGPACGWGTWQSPSGATETALLLGN